MNRLSLPLACCAAILLGGLVPARAAAPPDASAALARVVSPAPGTTLTAGSTVTLEWERGSGLAAMGYVEEWEAFLSLDGGRTFLTRLTPHLELDMRRVTVRLPELPSDDARLMLRFGDEREEREQLVPGRFHIVAAAAPRVTWRLPRLGRGEAARRGDPGVLAWVEGARDGTGWEECEGERAGDAWVPAFVPGALQLCGLGPVPSAASKIVRVALAAFGARVADGVAVTAARTGGVKAPRLSILCRRNV